MAEKIVKYDRHWKTGEKVPQTRSITYDALHDTGAFDPRWSDPDWIQERMDDKPIEGRTVLQVSIGSSTVAKLDVLAHAMDLKRGRVIDRLVKVAMKQFEEGTSRKGRKKNGEDDEED